MALFWMILTVAILATAQAQLIGRSALRGVRYSRKFNKDRCHAGDNLEMVEIIENDKRLPIPWLRLESEFPAVFRFRGSTALKQERGSVYQTHTSGFTIMPRRRVTRRHFVTCEGRGIFRLSTVFMTSGDLLGFVLRSRSENVQAPLIVYPRLLEERRLPQEWRSWQGEFAVRRWILADPFLIEGSREYAPGDPMNRIHWKASARTGGLQTYRQGHSADPRVMLVLDIGTVTPGLRGGGGEPEAEHAISLAATIAARLIADGVPVGLAHNAHTLSLPRIPVGGGAGQLRLLLEAMAGIRLKVQRSLAECLMAEAREVGPARDYIVIASGGEAGIGPAVARLERLGHKVSLIDPGFLSADGSAADASVDSGASRASGASDPAPGRAAPRHIPLRKEAEA
ncbi:MULTISPECIES: DUF58 domain-containing protein [Saccharibacillus]|uniref:DUF58 domain-containing protein n=1 Tax=Saccharibacillus TaxID=456492 RepID=UPI00123ADBD0|nr:DUF58 domain-containing protein [Saccharibacillus sp. WB 17]MWJ31032.1 DUF58 domain-containing protein [Saccharibacillus sp. WB 17]